jgi:hypothetical protein
MDADAESACADQNRTVIVAPEPPVHIDVRARRLAEAAVSGIWV